MLDGNFRSEEWLQSVDAQNEDFTHLSGLLTEDDEINEKILELIGQYEHNPKNKQVFDNNEAILDAFNIEIILGHIDPRDETLALNKIGITKIPSSLFEMEEYSDYFANLRALHCCDNHLSTLPENINKLSKLRVLNIEENFIKTLPDSLKELTEMTILRCEGNELTDIPDMFSGILLNSDCVPCTKEQILSQDNGPGLTIDEIHASLDRWPSPDLLYGEDGLDANDFREFLSSIDDDPAGYFREPSPQRAAPFRQFSGINGSSDGDFTDTLATQLAALETDSPRADADTYLPRNSSPKRVTFENNSIPRREPTIRGIEPAQEGLPAFTAGSFLPSYHQPRGMPSASSLPIAQPLGLRFYQGKSGEISLPHTDPNSSDPGSKNGIDVNFLRTLPTTLPFELQTWMQQKQENSPWNFPAPWPYYLRAHFALVVQEQEEDKAMRSEFKLR